MKKFSEKKTTMRAMFSVERLVKFSELLSTPRDVSADILYLLIYVKRVLEQISAIRKAAREAEEFDNNQEKLINKMLEKILKD